VRCWADALPCVAPHARGWQMTDLTDGAVFGPANSRRCIDDMHRHTRQEYHLDDRLFRSVRQAGSPSVRPSVSGA
jgi:hypothetical protein